MHSLPNSTVYATPRPVADVSDCYFYHTIEVPGYGLVEGEWDLRAGIGDYLGHVEFKGKRVLELGTASGFVCFHMERQGAVVVGYDLSDEQDWDVVPFARYRHAEFSKQRKEHIRKLNNAFWLCHQAFGSVSRMVYGDVYSVPDAIGPVDISTFCSILLHVRDPFLALQQGLRLTRETVIVTEPTRVLSPRAYVASLTKRVPDLSAVPSMTFLPDWRRTEPKETWWRLSPKLIQRFIGVLGFERSTVTYHFQKFRRGRRYLRLPQFTVVGHRTSTAPKVRS
jgi:SAM-dependent methyltransferase